LIRCGSEIEARKEVSFFGIWGRKGVRYFSAYPACPGCVSKPLSLQNPGCPPIRPPWLNGGSGRPALRPGFYCVIRQDTQPGLTQWNAPKHLANFLGEYVFERINLSEGDAFFHTRKLGDSFRPKIYSHLFSCYNPLVPSINIGICAWLEKAWLPDDVARGRGICVLERSTDVRLSYPLASGYGNKLNR